MMYEVFLVDPALPIHNVVFASPLKDRITITGKRRGKGIPYWLVATTQHFVAEIWSNDHTANHNWKYVLMSKRVQQSRARP